MGLFSNLRMALNAIARTMVEGTQILTEGAEILEAATTKLSKETQLSAITARFDILERQGKKSDELKDTFDRLLMVCGELEKISSESESDYYEGRRQHYTKRFRNVAVKEEVDQLLENSSEIRSEIARKQYRLPYNEQSDNKLLLRNLETLSALYSEKNEVNDQIADEITATKDRIEALELLRFDEVTNIYPDGSVKSKTQLRDGKLFGITEHWHPSGNLSHRFKFYDDGFIKEGMSWNGCGEIVTEIHCEINGNWKSTTYLPSGQAIYQIEIDNVKTSRNGRIQMWLWDGTQVIDTKFRHGKISKLALSANAPGMVWHALRLLFRDKAHFHPELEKFWATVEAGEQTQASLRELVDQYR